MGKKKKQGMGLGTQEVRFLNDVVKEDLIQKVMLEQRFEGSEGANEGKEQSRKMEYSNKGLEPGGNLEFLERG